MKRLIFLLLLLSSFLFAEAQTMQYNYTNPCTGLVETISVPLDGSSIAVTYYNQTQVFTQSDFLNGNFENWANTTYSTYKDVSPCGSLGLAQTFNQTQNSIMSVISILNTLSSLDDLAFNDSPKSNKKEKSSSKNGKSKPIESNPSNGSTSNPNGNSTTTNQSSGGSNQTGTNGTTPNNNQTGQGTPETNSGNNGSGGNQNSNSSTNSSTNVQGGNSGSTNQPTQGGSSQTQSTVDNKQSTQSGSSQTQSTVDNKQTTQNGTTSNTGSNTNTTPSGSNTNGNQTGSNTNNGGSSSNSTPSSGSNQNNTQKTPSDGEGKPTEKVEEGKGKVDVLSGGNSASNAENDREKNGGKPSIIGSGDMSGFKFNGNDPNSYKFNAGFTSVRYDRRASWGLLGDYTTALRGPNITFFKTFIGKRRVTLLANTLSLSFLPTHTNVYNTVVVGHIENVWKIKLLAVAAGSYGSVYDKPFWATAAVVGGMYNYMPKDKRFGLTVMGLVVYAPYVKYYEDIVLKSPWVLMPNLGLNYKVSKKFRINLGLGGAYAIEKDVMNYTLTLGSRLML